LHQIEFCRVRVDDDLARPISKTKRQTVSISMVMNPPPVVVFHLPPIDFDLIEKASCAGDGTGHALAASGLSADMDEAHRDTSNRDGGSVPDDAVLAIDSEPFDEEVHASAGTNGQIECRIVVTSAHVFIGKP
jgi:hypothetical protein